ncbi:hypothetical protein K435DRAFT_958880 [Dendrothele bispora CBS 962.96]|uniref:Uncharacterized protein n=1 Tax=Dendrothele bispora (strain CBS 962.96) TaxID=1314807 RepID=A0A4S8MY04_DENBC|nr:hypothetical protein K435DRAFT_958880 [Dendrothele bispora CBS 962.96]
MITHSVHWIDMALSPNHDDFSFSKDPSNASSSRWTTRSSAQSAPCHIASDVHRQGSQDPSCSQNHLFVKESRVEISQTTVIDYSDEYYSDGEESTFSDTPATYSEWDAELDNDCLRTFYRLRGSLVLDSPSPWFAPHIVITPCEDWDDDYAAWDNRIEPQNLDCLSVSDPSCPATTPHTPSPVAKCETVSLCELPPKVFSYSRFVAMIDQSSSDRMKMFDVVVAIQRRQCKLTACLASNVASSYRKRYDGEHLFEQLEKPFVWTDPAEPLLSCNNHLSEAIVIDSPCPFRIPHIIISAPPPEDPWACFINSVPNPQDSGYGYYLKVPGYRFVNPSPRDVEIFHYYSNCDEVVVMEASLEDCDEVWDEDEEEEEVYGTEFLSTLESYSLFDSTTPDNDADSLDSSDSDSPPPETPEDDAEDFHAFIEHALDRMTSVLNGVEPASEDLSPLAPCDLPVSSTWGDEDEDDLPPLEDEWYQSVIRRTQATEL